MDRKVDDNDYPDFVVGDEIRMPAQFRQNIGYAVRRAQIRIYNDFYDTLADLDTTPTRFTLMLLIRENPGIRAVDLARTLGVARSGMVKLVEGLEQRGLISREADPKDRRNQTLVLTQQGQRTLNKQENAVEHHEAKVTAGLSESEREQLLALLWRVAI
jgi:DNA-binding MarR family transcriptional regulator